MENIVFLKLGGSLITDKNLAHTHRPEVLERLAAEIALARKLTPSMHLLIGHGSGSFGHMTAMKYNTHEGVRTEADWLGFAEVWHQARTLNQLVVEALHKAGVPVIAVPPSAMMLARDGRPAGWDIHVLDRALQAGLVPLVNGDVVFDTKRGGTILSTEDVFSALAFALGPRRVLLAGVEPGVYADFPACQHLLDTISPATYGTYLKGIGGSASIDVTGGMRQKVELMLHLAQQVSGLDALIFSGLEPGNVRIALEGGKVGTRIAH